MNFTFETKVHVPEFLESVARIAARTVTIAEYKINTASCFHCMLGDRF